MSKDISTVPGKTYVVTLSQAGELSGVSGAGEPMVLASADSAGQVSFQAISQVTTCTDDGATVLPFCDAPLPIGVDGGASAKQVSHMVESALYESLPEVSRTIEGSGNATLNWWQLDARRVPAGRLQSISVPCRSNAAAGVGTTPLYLSIWERNEDNSAWESIGVSTEAVQQVVGTTSRWTFANLELSGRAIRICGKTEPVVGIGSWDSTQTFGVRMAAGETGEDSKGVGGSQVNQVVDMTFETVGLVPKFAPVDHVDDTTVHVSADERVWLDAARGGSQGLAAPTLTVKGTQGNNLLVVRGNETNVSVTGSVLSFNVPRLTVMSDCPALYSSSSDTGETHVWFAVAPDSLLLAPLGLTEPGVYAGDASLPLFLRGSELRINGTVIDVAALAQLAARKDELLALLNAGQAQVDGSGESG